MIDILPEFVLNDKLKPGLLEDVEASPVPSTTAANSCVWTDVIGSIITTYMYIKCLKFSVVPKYDIF